MSDARDTTEREKTARQIAKTRASIRRKYRELKTGSMENEMALERQFKPIIDPLKQIVEHVERGESKNDNVAATKGIVIKKKREDSESGDDDEGSFAQKIISRPKKRKKQIVTESEMLPIHSTPLEPRKLSPYERMEVFETHPSPLPSLETSVRDVLRTPQGQEELHSQLGPLGQRYVGALLSGDPNNEIDHVYGVYFGNDGTMLGDKRFDVNADDSVIVNGVNYVGTPGLYELILRDFPMMQFTPRTTCKSTEIYCWRQTLTDAVTVLLNP